MGTRVIGPKEFGKMLGVSDHTAAVHMRNHPRCINVGLGSKEYLRLPIEDAEEIVKGLRSLSPIPDKPKPVFPVRKEKARASSKRVGPQYVAYR